MAQQLAREARRSRIEVGWGLLCIFDEPAGERVEVLWGLVSLRTGRRRSSGTLAQPEERGSAPAPRDGFEAAIRRTDDRMETLRAGLITGSVAGALYYLSVISANEGWQAIWFVGALVTGAVSGGLLLGVFAEGFRRRWLGREFRMLDAQRDVRRVVASQHTQALQELTASIAHEIRNPITAAKSLVQQMGDDPGGEDNVEFASVALEELERVERSVSHLLRFAKDEEIELRELRLSETIDAVLDVLRSRAASVGVEISKEARSDGVIAGDAEKLRRVFLNLVGNALDALSSEARSDTKMIRVELGENLAGTDVWVRVRDNGPGIEPARLGKIFNPFHTSKESGTGLGLPICKKIVEGHAGTIEVSSTPGEGADFVVTFPKLVGSVAD